MANALPWYKRRPRDFFEGTVGMLFEDKAAYGLLLDIIYMRGGDLPDDARYISGLLGASVRKWNIIRARLIESGKIDVIDGFIRNQAADREIQSTSEWRDRQSRNARSSEGNLEKNSSLSPDNRDDKSPKAHKNNGLEERSSTLIIEPEPELSSSSSRARDIADAVDLILAACGPGCADPTKSPSVILSATRCYRKWVDADFDFDLDILPVIRLQTQNARIKPLTALDVLESDIALHHARRTATVETKEIENAPGAYPGATGRFASGSGGGSRSFDVVGVVRDVVEGRGAASDR